MIAKEIPCYIISPPKAYDWDFIMTTEALKHFLVQFELLGENRISKFNFFLIVFLIVLTCRALFWIELIQSVRNDKWLWVLSHIGHRLVFIGKVCVENDIMDYNKLVLFHWVLNALPQLTCHEAPLYTVIFLFLHQTFYVLIRGHFFFALLAFVRLTLPFLLLNLIKVFWIATAVRMVLGQRIYLLFVAILISFETSSNLFLLLEALTNILNFLINSISFFDSVLLSLWMDQWWV